jgi:hypothetical protein
MKQDCVEIAVTTGADTVRHNFCHGIRSAFRHEDSKIDARKFINQVSLQKMQIAMIRLVDANSDFSEF